MKNTFGQSVSVTLFGESHGDAVGAVLDGIAPGIKIDMECMTAQLALRAAGGPLSTSRKEPDQPQILSGVFQGYTTGTPICILIRNTNTRSSDYGDIRYKPRPGHADYTAQMKYHGFQDYRGGGHFSGRITAALVAAGSIALAALRKKNIYIGTHLLRCAGISDRAFENIEADVRAVADKEFAVLDDEAGRQMREKILQAKSELDSVGGVLQTAVTGMPAGVGEPWFDAVESMLAHALFAVPAVKGVEFGAGFAMADMRGSAANDEFEVRDGRIVTRTNNNGGINGGITNGMPIIFNCAVKPTASIARSQQTVDLENMFQTALSIHGRHDPAIVHRARAVVNAVTALVLCDALAQRFGTDYIGGSI